MLAWAVTFTARDWLHDISRTAAPSANQMFEKADSNLCGVPIPSEPRDL